MSKIEWTDTTWNPVTGCTKTSPGCKHCYAETMAERCKSMGLDKYRDGFQLTLHPDVLGKPLKWRKPRRIFVNSMSDLFHPDVPHEYIAAVFGVMAACPQHMCQVLTKRAERLPEFFERLSAAARESFEDAECRGPRCSDIERDAWLEYKRAQHLELAYERYQDGEVRLCLGKADIAGMPFEPYRTHRRHVTYSEWPLPNVWLGVSVEDRKHGLPRIEYLRRTPAAVRFLSIEPLLEDLGEDWSLDGIDWVIVGGESGPGARPMHPDWVRRIRDKVLTARRDCSECVGMGMSEIMEADACRACGGRGWKGPALFFKQWGAWAPIDQPWKQASPRPLAKNERWLNNAGGHGFHGEQVWRMRNVGKGKAGRELDGRTWDEMPVRMA